MPAAYLEDLIAGQPSDGLDRDQPTRGGGSGRVRAHRRHHRGAEDRRAYPRQPAGLRPGDRRKQRPGPGRGHAGRAAAVPRQRHDRHRHRAAVQRGPRGVARPGRLPRPGPVRALLEDRRSTTASPRCPPSPPSTAPWPGCRWTPTSAHCGCPSWARRRCPQRCARPSPGAPGCACWRVTGSPRRPAPAPGAGPARSGTGSVGRALPGQQVKAVRIRADGSWADCAPGETGVLAIGGPAVFAGYLTDPGLGGPRVSRERRRPGRLAGHRGSRLRRRRGFRLPHRPGQGPHHPGRAQHRPPGDRGSPAAPLPPSPPPRPSAPRTRTRVKCRSPTSSPPTPASSTRRNCWPGPAPPSVSAPPGRNGSTPSRPSPSPRSASTTSPRWPPTRRRAPPPRPWPAPACRPAVQVTAEHENGRLVVTVTGADPGQVQARPGRVRPHRPHPAVAPRESAGVQREREHRHEGPAPPPRRPRAPSSPSSWSAPARSAPPPPCCSPTPGSRSPCWNGTSSRTRCPARCTSTTRSPGSCTALGVSEEFLARSRPCGGLRLLDARHQVMAEFGREQAGVHGFPQANMFHQPDLEELLLARVGQHPLISFHRGAEVFRAERPARAAHRGPGPVRRAAAPDGEVRDIHRMPGAGLRRCGQHDPGTGRDHHARSRVHRTVAGHRHPGRGRPGHLGRRRTGLRPGPGRHLHAGHRRPVPLGVPAARR